MSIFSLFPLKLSERVDWQGGNALGLYSGGLRFESPCSSATPDNTKIVPRSSHDNFLTIFFFQSVIHLFLLLHWSSFSFYFSSSSDFLICPLFILRILPIFCIYFFSSFSVLPFLLYWPAKRRVASLKGLALQGWSCSSLTLQPPPPHIVSFQFLTMNISKKAAVRTSEV